MNPTKPPPYSLATLSIHGDDACNSYTDVAPALHVSTTFRYPSDPSLLIPTLDDDTPTRNPLDPAPPSTHIYSRLSTPNTTRLESILSSLLNGPTLTYSSGLAAFHALLVYLHPQTVAIGAGYHGCHGVLSIYQKLTNCSIVDLHDETTWGSLGAGDIVHIETPLNPTGEATNIAAFAKKAHARGALLTVDATFAPPPLQDPFVHEADFVMHSGTKYFGGHSDMLCGVIAINPNNRRGQNAATDDYWGMWKERLVLGAVMGSLEGWLGVRSLRTFELRIRRQSTNAGELVAWLSGLLNGGKKEGEEEEGDDVDVVRKTVLRLQHSSLQEGDKEWIEEQMPGGHGPVFAIWMRSEALAKTLPSKTRLFHHATSLGGVESLIEWRRMSDDKVDPRVLRVSVGAENIVDLKADLLAACRGLVTYLPARE